MLTTYSSKMTHRPLQATSPQPLLWVAHPKRGSNTQRLLTLALVVFGHFAVFAQTRPFPQQLTYPGCIKPNHVPQATLNRDALAYYTYWKGRYLRQSTVNPAHYYVAARSTGGSGGAVTQSEAHGYGMVITALLAGADPNAKTYYDGLYRMYDTHRSVNNPHLMQWQVFADERNAGLGSATDGDLDIAYSLLLAHYQWGSTGSIDYLDAAQKMITDGLEASCVYSTLRLGLSDDPTPDHLSTRPSDWMFDHLRAFQAHTNRGVWNQLATNLYAVYNTIYTNNSSATGLISDFVMYAPPRPAPPYLPQPDEGPTTGDYALNACRVPLRLVMDFAHYGSPAPVPLLTKMVAWAKTTAGNDPTAVQAGYRLNGTPLPGANYPSAVFISPLVAASVIDPANQQWLNDGWDYMKATRDSYFEDTYNLLCVLFVSGNWWAPAAAPVASAAAAPGGGAIALSAYPNPVPAGRRLTVDLGATYPAAQAVLTDVRGATLATYAYRNMRRAELTLPAGAKGALLLKVTAGNHTVVQKILTD